MLCCGCCCHASVAVVASTSAAAVASAQAEVTLLLLRQVSVVAPAVVAIMSVCVVAAASAAAGGAAAATRRVEVDGCESLDVVQTQPRHHGAVVLQSESVESMSTTKRPHSRNQEARGEGSHAEGQASLVAGAPCALSFQLKWPRTPGSECTR